MCRMPSRSFSSPSLFISRLLQNSPTKMTRQFSAIRRCVRCPLVLRTILSANSLLSSSTYPRPASPAQKHRAQCPPVPAPWWSLQLPAANKSNCSPIDRRSACTSRLHILPDPATCFRSGAAGRATLGGLPTGSCMLSWPLSFVCDAWRTATWHCRPKVHHVRCGCRWAPFGHWASQPTLSAAVLTGSASCFPPPECTTPIRHRAGTATGTGSRCTQVRAPSGARQPRCGAGTSRPARPRSAAPWSPNRAWPIA